MYSLIKSVVRRNHPLLKSLGMWLVVVQLLSHVRLFVTPWTVACQASLSFTISRVCSNSCPLSQRYHPTISSSVIHFSSCLQFFPASGSFLMSQFFASGGQNTGTSISTSVLPMNIRGWFLLGLTGLISLLSRELWIQYFIFSFKVYKKFSMNNMNEN